MALTPQPSFYLLPNELVREVILAGIPPQRFIDERDNFPAARYRDRWLVRLARVSKEWKDICIPLLYREAIFELSRQGEEERLELFYRRLDLVPSLGHHLRRLHWTQDFYQSAEVATKLFLDRSHLFSSLQSVSVVSALSSNPALPSSAHPSSSLDQPILPNLNSLRLVSWDVEPDPEDEFPFLPPPSDRWYRQRCLLTSNAYGSLTNLDDLHLSFQNIAFVFWLLSSLYHRTTPSSLALKHLHLFGAFVLPPSASHPTPTRPFHHLLTLLALVGPTLQTLHLNRDDYSIFEPPLPFPSEILSLCPNVVQLSLDTTADLLPLTLSFSVGLQHLTSLWIGHSAWQRRLEDNGQAIRRLVEGVASSLLPFLSKDGDASKEGGGGRTGFPFPKLKEVGFWGLDFRIDRGLGIGAEEGWERDWEWEEVKRAGKMLADERAGVRLVDRFGIGWEEGV